MQHQNPLFDFWKQELKVNEKLLKSFRAVKREHFILDEYKEHAYDDIPLPILREKTISQPTTVMLMTSALELEEGDKVFEVGSGSGYQGAIIASVVGKKGKVISAEIVPELVSFAKQNLIKARINNVQVIEEDGSKGFEKEAPFDKIIITAACKEFPKELLDQLKPEGVIVGPVGNADEQELVRGRKDKRGKLELDFLGQFLFSPMYGKYGFEE